MAVLGSSIKTKEVLMFGIADVYTVFFLVLGILIAFPGMMSIIIFGLPKLASRSQVRIEQTPIASFLVGLPVAGIGGTMAAGLMGSGGPLAAMGVVLAVILILFSLAGAAGMVLLIGRRMFGEARTIPLKPVLMGALAYELAILFPIIGWVFFLPLLFVLTTGAGLFSLVRWMPRMPREPGVPNGATATEPIIRVQVSPDPQQI